MYKDIEINLDISNYEVGVKKLLEVERAIQRGLDAGLEELAYRLEEKMLENLVKYGLGSSKLADTIFIEDIGNAFRISVGADYAMYVEYGTGIVGSENPHPHPWAYDIKEHGEAGWIYKGADGKLHWTAGSPAKPFIYDTWLWGSRSANNIIRKHIRRALKEV